MKRQDERPKSERGRVYPDIKIVQWMDSDFASYVEVSLGNGQGICSVDRPIATTAEITSQPLTAGFRWTTADTAKLVFGLGAANSAKTLSLGDSYLVASDLIYAWTDGVTFQHVSVPGVPGISWASGLGTVVMRCPGYAFGVGSFRRQPPLLVDPAHFVYAEAAEPAAEVVTDEQGQSWLKLTSQNGTVHTFKRAASRVTDAIPLPD
jgi:hypothetical protein